MLEILRMQLRQIVGGRKKWLVALIVLLPLALTWVNVHLGGLGKLRDRLNSTKSQGVEAAPVPPSPGARQIVSTGPPVELLGGRIVVMRDQVRFDGDKVERGTQVVVNRGYIVITDGRVWLDESRATTRNRTSIRIESGNGFGEALHELPRAWELVSAIYLFLLYPQLICLLLALLYGASIPGAELEAKTLTYLFTRPIARWRIVVGKYLAIVLAILPPTLVSVAISWWLLGQPGSVTLLWSLELAAAGAVLCYTAIFILFGFLAPRRAMVVALLYGVVFEFLLSFVPAMINTITATYYLRSLVVNVLQLEVPVEIARIVGGATTPAALGTLSATILVALALASWLAARREYVLAEEP